MKTFNTILLSGLLALGVLPAVAQSGQADAAFNNNGGTGPDDYLGAVAVQPDGSILIGGFMSNFDGTSQEGLARLFPDGTLDPSLTVGSGFNQFIHEIVVQPDGKIIVAGEYTQFQGGNQGGLVRLLPDGTLDAPFNTGAELSAPGRGYALALQPDGKILIGGDFTSFRGTIVNNMTRALPDGLRDMGFACPTNGSVHAVALQPDGKIILGGDFTTCNGVAMNRIARVNADGSLDATFNVGTGFTAPQFQNRIVKAITLQPDGRILVGGVFNAFNGATHGGLIRLMADGSHDPSFDVGVGCGGTNPRVEDFVLLPNGDVFVAGEYGGIDGNYTFDGSGLVDETGAWKVFGDDQTQFLSGRLYDAQLQADGKLLVVGDFGYFDNDITAYGLLRFGTDFSTGMAAVLGTSQLLTVAPNPVTNGTLEVRWPKPFVELMVRVVDTHGRTVLTTVSRTSGATERSLRLHLPAGTTPGVYLLTATAGKETLTQRLVVE